MFLFVVSKCILFYKMYYFLSFARVQIFDLSLQKIYVSSVNSPQLIAIACVEIFSRLQFHKFGNMEWKKFFYSLVIFQVTLSAGNIIDRCWCMKYLVFVFLKPDCRNELIHRVTFDLALSYLTLLIRQQIKYYPRLQKNMRHQDNHSLLSYDSQKKKLPSSHLQKKCIFKF